MTCADGESLGISEGQWFVLELLMRSRQRGIGRISRRELLHNRVLSLKKTAVVTWAALTMPRGLLMWHSLDDFSITEAGMRLYAARFGEEPMDRLPEINVGDL